MNMLSGPASSSLSGPPAALQGALGIAPASNMLAGPQGPSVPSAGGGKSGAGAQEPAPQPPDKATLIDVAHRTAYVSAALRALLPKPNLSARDVIDAVGDMIAEGTMSSFQAAKYLVDLPDDTPQIRQWVATHFANSQQTLATVSQMIDASGRLSRRPPRPPMQQPPSVASNLLSGMPSNG